jgi:uncharacterized protein
MSTHDFLFSQSIKALDETLTNNPSLATSEIDLPDNPATAHPLHRICDVVFSGLYPEETGLEMAKIFLKHGAEVNPVVPDGKDSPLTAACSLGCDAIALLYIDHGARVDHRGCHGGTALHWSAWCGRDVLVERLVRMHSDINQLCTDFKSTPLFWAIHGHRFSRENKFHQVECARILLAHGADPSIPNFEGYRPVQILGEEDRELKILLTQK